MLKNEPRWLYGLTQKLLEDQSIGGESYSPNKVSIHPRRYMLQTTHRIASVREKVLKALEDRLKRHEIDFVEYEKYGAGNVKCTTTRGRAG